MRDHYLVDEVTGRRVPVAELPTATVRELLETGVEVVDPYEGPETAADVMARLRIELVARELEGRL